MFIRGNYIKSYTAQDLITWPALKPQLVLDDDTFKDMALALAESEVINCEIYLNRALISGEITANYDAYNITVTGLFLPIPITRGATPSDVEIEIDGTALESSKYTVSEVNTGRIIFNTPITPDQNKKTITVKYEAQVYEHRTALIPGIMLKITQYFTKRENDGEGRIRTYDPALSIYNRHRIKTSF